MKKEIIINNKLEDIELVSQLIEEFGALLNIPSKTIMSIDLAVEEIVLYIIQHCYPQGKSSYIKFQVEVSPDVLTFRLTDEGLAFNPFHKNDTREQIVLKEHFGKRIGHFLIHRTMDEVSYQSAESQNILTLTKRINAEVKPEDTLTTNICKIDSFIVLDIKGRLDTANSYKFNTAIQSLLEEEQPNIIINCEQMSYISSLGLRNFLLLQKHVHKNQGSLIIEAMQPEIKHIFEMTGCTSLFQIH